jgi:hypothetical protein
MVENGETVIQESTQPKIGNYLVGVANIWERDLPDDNGVVASRVSASVTVFDPTTNESHREFVVVGSTLLIGNDRYRVVHIDEGHSDLGAITVSRIAAEGGRS